jgi:hypothetical protein
MQARLQEKGTFIHCWWECKLEHTVREKSVRELPQKLKIELPCDTAVPLMGKYLKECESAYNRDFCMTMYLLQHHSQ